MTDDYHELTPAELAYRWRERTVLESVDEAVADLGREDYATADSTMRWLLRCAWHDLSEERGRAINGKWSMSCDHQVSRIVGLTRLVGPLSWECVPVSLIMDGVYERVHEAMGSPTPMTESDRARARAVMHRRRP